MMQITNKRKKRSLKEKRNIHISTNKFIARKSPRSINTSVMKMMKMIGRM